uniref:Uncharacterized protein n=1 Tax=Sus scrofa TaxID=9823 RepID=A0A8D1SZD5_PIG
MEPPPLRKAGSRQEDGFGGPPGGVAATGMVPNLRRSNSSLCRNRRPQFLNNCEKQANLSSWIPENIKKKECVHFVERSKLSDAGGLCTGLQFWFLKQVCKNSLRRGV